MEKKTEKALFVRPNLKLLVLAALGLIVIDHLTGSSSGEAILNGQIPIHLTPPRDQEIEQLLDQTLRAPSMERFNALGEIYRLRGENAKAMHYIRKAAILSDIEANE